MLRSLHLERKLTIFIVSLALFMDVLDSNIINTAIPSMSHSLNVNPVDLKIALISYLLSLAVFIPTSGWVADRYGTKYVFLAAIFLFTISSFFCGYAHTLTELVIARLFQGVGGAFMLSLGRLIIARTFKQHELIDAMNIVVIVISVAIMVGPYIGGVITDRWSWPWIFWVNIPAGLITFLLAAYCLRDGTIRHYRPFDKLGFVLFGGGLALTCFALSEMSDSQATLHRELMTAGMGVMMIFAFYLHAMRIPYPIINTSLFRIRTFRISVIGNLTSRLGFGGIPFLIPLLLQICFGYSAELSGLLIVPIAFGIIIAKLVSIHLMRRFGYQLFLITNTLLVALILYLFQLITQHTSVFFIAGMTFLFGVGTSMQYTALNSLAFADLHEDELSASTSITSTTQQLAQSFGVAAGAILLRVFSSWQGAPLQLSTAVFHQVFAALSLLTCLAAFVFFAMKRDDGAKMLVKPPNQQAG